MTTDDEDKRGAGAWVQAWVWVPAPQQRGGERMKAKAAAGCIRESVQTHRAPSEHDVESTHHSPRIDERRGMRRALFSCMCAITSNNGIGNDEIRGPKFRNKLTRSIATFID